MFNNENAENKRELWAGDSSHAPPDKRQKIVIPSREGTYCFNRNTFKEEILKDLITKFEYDKIIENASKIMGNALLIKRTNDHFEVSNWVIFFGIFSSALVVFYLFALYTSQSSNSESILYISIAAVALALTITFIQSIYNFCRSTRKYMTIEEIIKRDLDNYFEKINNTYYFTKVNDKYVYSGSLNFNYITGKKIIECFVEKNDEGLNELVSQERNVIRSEERKKCKGSSMRRNVMFQEKPKLEQLEVGEDYNFYEDQNSVIKEEDENGLESERRGIENKISRHFRVKSTVSIGNKSVVLDPKELEIELNKTHSIKT